MIELDDDLIIDADDRQFVVCKIYDRIDKKTGKKS